MPSAISIINQGDAKQTDRVMPTTNTKEGRESREREWTSGQEDELFFMP